MIDVWPEHHATWDAWLSMNHQWRMASDMDGGGYLGLNFPSIPVALEMAGVKKKQRQKVMQNLRFMEDEALAAINAPADGAENDGQQ